MTRTRISRVADERVFAFDRRVMGAELIALFEESVVDVRHLAEGARYTVGEATEASLSCAGLGPLREVVRVGDAGIELVHSDEIAVEVLDRDMALTWTRELSHDRLVALLPDGARARLTFGAVSLLVGKSAAPERRALDPRLDLRDHVATVGVGLLALLCLFMLNAIPPEPSSLALDENLLHSRAARFLLRPPEPPKAMSSGIASAAPSGGGHRAPAQVRRALSPNPKPGVPKKAGNPLDAKQAAEVAASTAGILGLVQQSSHVGSIFGATSAFGAGGVEAMGEITDQSGCGGCGASESSHSWGSFTRGGGRADSIAAGPISSHGGPGPGRPMIGIRKHDASIEVSTGPTVNVDSAYDKATIRRVIHSYLPAYRFCYEKELQGLPDLSGRVVTRFTLDAMGRVVASMIESSTMHNANVEGCLSMVTKRLSFPKAQGHGLTIVSYPFVFKSPAQN